MRRLSRNDRGLSEIVGTLMLVIIVVSAATLLAAFVASYQKQLQTEEAFSHDQSLESIKVLGLVTSLDGTGTAYRFINFTLASEYVNPSIILYISIDNYPLVKFWWEDLTTHVWTDQALGTNLTLAPQEEIYVSTSTSPSNNSFLFPPPAPSQYLKFDVFTALQNDFSQVFLPPTAFGVVSEINPSGSNPITLLDGSESFQPGGNASIVDWTWEITGGEFVSDHASLSAASLTQGGVAVANGTLTTGNVSGSNATATFTVPAGFTWGGAYSAAFSTGANLTITGAGCQLTGSAITSVTSGVVSGTNLTLTFSFGTSITGSCTAGTLNLVPSAVSLTQSASGQEFEVSPALGPGAYTVVLVVTNSDGLLDGVSLSYVSP